MASLKIFPELHFFRIFKSVSSISAVLQNDRKKNHGTLRNKCCVTFYRNGAPQPDNHEGIKEGPIETEFDIGVTIENLQEYHDEACLAMLNNKYRDGIAWHDVACHFRSVIVCEDSDQLIALVQQQNGVDVSNTVKKGEDSRLVDPDTVLATEAEYQAEQARLAAQRPQRPRFGPPGFGRPRPPRRPSSGGFFSGFPFRLF